MTAKILVVDDEPQLERLILQRFRKKVKSQEYNFTFARDGVEALEKVTKDNNYDIVLSDINMPKMDGLTFIAQLQKIRLLLKTIMVSAYGDMKNIRTASGGIVCSDLTVENVIGCKFCNIGIVAAAV